MSEPASRTPTFWQSVQSVAAAFFGVQTSENRKRDFTHGKPVHFIVIGIVMTIVLIVTLVFVVKIALRNAGL